MPTGVARERERLPLVLCWDMLCWTFVGMCVWSLSSHEDLSSIKFCYATTSPDTSMVWSSSNEWKSSWKHYDNLDAANIYHKLQQPTPMTDSSCSVGTSSSISSPSSPYAPRPESPIYAEPWTHYNMQLLPSPRHASTPSQRTPLVVRNASFRPPSPLYAQPYATLEVPRPRVYEAPPSTSTFGAGRTLPALPRRAPSEVDDDIARDVFLCELDAQIHELQLRSEELREMVDRARAQRKEFIIPRLECTFELAI
ncbi:unnamed protein product [Caenorhabditis auriculariae]|uniref:Uncharacterized protein n=1 Tax=Caenorhabditis auriculariae TaxID=2777116 RepID=A0A8S1HQK5_9PELO|nr:unnamed protein product [Caenorhabditis auriculariae]